VANDEKPETDSGEGLDIVEEALVDLWSVANRLARIPPPPTTVTG